MSNDDAKTEAQKQLKYKAVQGGQVYRHQKGGLYVVVCTALDEATLEPLVVYRSCERGTIWVRTMKNFTECVVWVDDVETKNRFTEVK